jgi:hypothetical protein
MVRKSGGNEMNEAFLGYVAYIRGKDKPLGLLGCRAACDVVIWCPPPPQNSFYKVSPYASECSGCWNGPLVPKPCCSPS